ncbi:MAG: hypothetical protein R3F65_18080 [bacterium]
MSLDGKIKRAKLTPQTGPYEGETVDVHFNPVSLEYSISNTLDSGRGDKKKQFVSQTSGKLSMELVFDTTDRGADVRDDTVRIARMMRPDDKRTPAVIAFEWGTYAFSGMVESYKEKLDFFSADGVPLRSTISLTLAAQDVVFPEGGGDGGGGGDGQAREVAAPPAQFGGLQQTASEAGDARGARALGEQNGEDNLRFPSGGALTVPGDVPLSPPVAFAGGGAGGIGAQLGASFGVSAGASFGAGFGIGAGIGAGIGGGASLGVGVGASASFGVAAGLTTAGGGTSGVAAAAGPAAAAAARAAAA